MNNSIEELHKPTSKSIENKSASTTVQHIKQKGHSLTILEKCFSIKSKFITNRHESTTSTKNDVDSDYCIIHNDDCKHETSDGWMVVSDE